MSESNPTLAIFARGWQAYQDELRTALAPLTAEQLELRAAPDLRSIGDLARHLIAVRARWFYNVLAEGDEAFAAIGQWDRPGAPARDGAELADGLATTWRVMQEALARYTPDDLEQQIERERDGEKHTFARGWVVWHVIEHDLHHGGEIGYSLGMHGLAAPDI
jgi:uncharacterized damage-inducible protein DinB